MKFISLFFLLLFPKIIFAQDLPILINQIMIGQNEGAKNEFIELYNPNSSPVSLNTYNLKKKTASGSESNLISAKNFIGTIPAQGYFLISSPEFGPQINSDLNYSSTASLAKNNTILLYDQNKNLSDKLGYGEIINFFGSPNVNPDNNKVLKRINTNPENPNNLLDFKLIENNIEIRNSQNQIIKINNYYSQTESPSKTTKSKTEKINQKINISNIKNYKNGDLIISEGLVVSLPGQFGKQYFYIVEENNINNNYLAGIQVYNYNKNFPTLKMGDKIIVSGEIVNNKDYNWKIKTKNIEDIIIISSDNKIPEINISKILELNPQYNGNLFKVKGTIVQNKTNAIYLDDSENEIIIDIKKGTGIAGKNLKENNNYIISGILLADEKTIKIMPSSEEAIISLSPEEEKTGELITDSYLKLEKENKIKNLLLYFFISIFLIITAFVFEKKIRNFFE